MFSPVLGLVLLETLCHPVHKKTFTTAVSRTRRKKITRNKKINNNIFYNIYFKNVLFSPHI